MFKKTFSFYGIFLCLYILSLSVFAQGIKLKYVNDQNKELTVLKKGIVGHKFVFGNWQKTEDETHLTYLGEVLTLDRKRYKVLTSVWLWGSSKRATNRILIYNHRNNYIGDYKLIMKDDLPVKMENGVLSFLNTEDCNKRSSVKIDLTKGIPKELFIGCNDKGGDSYIFDRTLSK